MGALEFRASGWKDESGRTEQSESLFLWKYEEDGSVTYRFHVPFGAKALICLPDGRTETVAAGDYTY